MSKAPHKSCGGQSLCLKLSSKYIYLKRIDQVFGGDLEQKSETLGKK